MAKNNKTLYHVLNRKWWDMIPSSEKKEEYRDANLFSTEEGKKWKEEMFSQPTKEEVDDVRKASEEL